MDVPENSEKIMQAKMIIAPSRQCAAKPRIKLMPVLCVGSPAKEARGMGAKAMYRYMRKNRPNTDSMTMIDIP